MFSATYPGLDEAEETEASFRAMIDAIPAAIKRRWGYRVMTEERQMDEADEIERLEGYTRWR